MKADSAQPRYPNVFSPLRIGPVEVRNRMYMAPHGIPLEAPTPGQEAYRVPASAHAHYFAERAAGGVGLIFHSTTVGPIATFARFGANPWLPEGVPSYRRVAELVHENGAKIMAQVHYAGHSAKLWEPLGPQAPVMRASPIQHYLIGNTGHGLTKEEIGYFVDLHAQSARHLREAGYDGIELHVSHGALFEHFVTAYYNKRTDAYGGTLENRLRFLVETLEAVRGETADSMAVGIRFTADQLLPGANTEEDAKEILEYLARTGLLDFVDIDIAVEPEQGHLMLTPFFVPALHNLQRVLNVAPSAAPLVVLATPGQLSSLDDAEALLASGGAHMVGAVRALIADPQLVEHARAGRDDLTRPCIRANHCFEWDKGGFGCAVNPTAAREERWGFRKDDPAPAAKRVVIVGGGPAGLEAARVATRRGHGVTVLERADRLGGGLLLWSQIPGRERLATFIRWLEDRVAETGADIRTGIEADEDTILGFEPDVVFVATGSRYKADGESGYMPWPVPGWERDFVLTPETVIRGDTRLTGRVIVLDEEGMHAAAGAAEIGAAAGADIELVTRRGTPFGGLVSNHHIESVLPRLHHAGVRISTGTYVKEIGDHTVTLVQPLTKEERVVDGVAFVVLATMREPQDELAFALDGKVPALYLVGDALAPRTLKEATYEGHRFARWVGEPDMPATVAEDLFRLQTPLVPAEFA